MLAIRKTVPSFSVNDTSAAKEFYGGVLGFAVHDGPMGTLDVRVPGGFSALIYPKEDHRPADFTILNLMVDDVEAAVDSLNEQGVATAIYGDVPELNTDAKGVAHYEGHNMAWFRDPAGNVLSVMEVTAV
jgi:catechol 2,3-dioxygenase-like lactoylglutathione lyase family enzyme